MARRPTPPTPAPPAYKTRSLTGARASDGYNQTRADVLKLVTVGLLEGFAIRRVKAFNDRIFLARYRRSYWLGTRYYELVSQARKASELRACWPISCTIVGQSLFSRHTRIVRLSNGR